MGHDTVRLFKTADELGVSYVLAKEMTAAAVPSNCDWLDPFIKRQEKLYLTIYVELGQSRPYKGTGYPDSLS